MRPSAITYFPENETVVLSLWSWLSRTLKALTAAATTDIISVMVGKNWTDF